MVGDYIKFLQFEEVLVINPLIKTTYMYILLRGLRGFRQPATISSCSDPESGSLDKNWSR